VNFANYATQTENDATPNPGRFCFVTGQGGPGLEPDDHDVDNGRTSLVSPIFDVSQLLDPILTYWRWYQNNGGANPGLDSFTVGLSPDSGVSWVTLEKIGYSQNQWIKRMFPLAGQVPLTAVMRLRVSVSDFGGPSTVEAAFDDFAVSGPLLGDLTGDFRIDLADAVTLVNAVVFGQPLTPPEAGDLNGDCATDLVDIVTLVQHLVFGLPLSRPCGG
jgi:hypothetical protein